MSTPPSARQMLFELQKQQFSHDENFHREIARLTLPHRLTHMALHISKYFSRIVAEQNGGEKAHKAWLDTFIISTSIANILNLRLSDMWGIIDDALVEPHLKRWIATQLEGRSPLLDLSRINDELSSACEKLDHVENYSFRPTIAKCAGSLSLLAANECMVRFGSLKEPVTARLLETKKKNIFFSEG